MKNSIIFTIILSVITISSCGTQKSSISSDGGDSKSKTIVVRGNCGMCQTTIENAAKSVNGVSSAKYDIENETLKVSFDPSVTNVELIETAVADTGYDTKNKVGNQEAYKNLPACCVYDNKKQ